MRQKIIQFRGFGVTKKELIADIIFLLVAFLISLLMMYIFDAHWSFYPGETIIPPSKYVGLTNEIYLTGSLIGSIIGFFIIKLFLIGVKEDIKK
ncbi:MAG: hypothetical protein ABIG37_02740 [Nanoarchaeota archaeon]|nr:hypothetical protein [Nanoarchaeota archaeon]